MTYDLRLVRGDHGHATDVTLVSQRTGAPIDVAGATVRLYLRQVGAAELRATIIASLPGGGTDGRARFVWPAGALDVAGDYEGEIEITAGTVVQSVYRKLAIHVREQVQV